jgi:hypothetical protein
MPKDKMETGETCGSTSESTKEASSELSQIIRFLYGQDTLSLIWNPKQEQFPDEGQTDGKTEKGNTNNKAHENANGNGEATSPNHPLNEGKFSVPIWNPKPEQFPDGGQTDGNTEKGNYNNKAHENANGNGEATSPNHPLNEGNFSVQIWNPNPDKFRCEGQTNGNTEKGNTNNKANDNAHGNGEPISPNPPLNEGRQTDGKKKNEKTGNPVDNKNDNTHENYSSGTDKQNTIERKKTDLINKNIREIILFLIKEKVSFSYFTAIGTLLMLGTLLGFILSELPSNPHRTIYVNPYTGIDSAEGSSSAPLLTIKKALAKAQRGDHILLQTGDYAATNQAFPFVVPPNVTIIAEPNITFFPVFRDIKGHLAEEAIQKLAMERIITGFPDGTFQPDAQVNRAQYAAMLVQAFNPVPKLEPKAFADVKPDFWAQSLIQKAYRSQFLVGFPEKKEQPFQGNTFQPNNSITTAEVIVSLVNGLGLNADNDKVVQPYSDQSEIPDWARQQVNTAVTRNLIENQPNSKLNPNQPATRAEVAEMIYRARLKQQTQ